MTTSTSGDPIEAALAHAQDSTGAERMDRTITVTRMRGWLALVTIAVLTLSAIAWTVLAQIPQQFRSIAAISAEAYSRIVASPVTGTLIFVSGASTVAAGDVVAQVEGFDGAVSEILAPARGQWVDVEVNVGQGVAAGQTIGTLNTQIDPLEGVSIVTFIPESEALLIPVGTTVETTITNVRLGTSFPLLAEVTGVAGAPSDEGALLAVGGSTAIVDAWQAATDSAPYRVDLFVKTWPSDAGPVPPAGSYAASVYTYAYVRPIDELLGS